MRSRILVPALAVAFLLAACSPGATETATSAPGSPTAIAAPSQSEEAARFEAFRTHVAAESATLSHLVVTFSTAAGKGNVASVKKVATTIRSWAKAEAAWLDAADTAGCFAAAFLIWDAVRQDADNVAADALAGKYEKAASDIDALTAAAMSLSNRLPAVVCP